VGGLLKSRSYFFQVRGVNGSAVGKRSQRVGHATIRTQGSATGPTYRVMTYNVCSSKCSDWPRRSVPAADRIATFSPDVLAAQEASNLATPDGYTRAYDKSAKRLFFKTSRFDLVRANYIYLGNGRYAVWAELIDKASQQHVIFVDTHLTSGSGEAEALARRDEVTVLLRQVAAINPGNLPVVHAGDYNSHKNRSNDYVADVFHASGVYDAYD